MLALGRAARISLVAALFLVACSQPATTTGAPDPGSSSPTPLAEVDHGAGRIGARPGEPTLPPLPPGLHRLPFGAGGTIYVPKTYRRHRPAPFAVMLHGAGSTAWGGMHLFRPWADAAGAILVAPKSHGVTWDASYGGFGPDVETIDRAMRMVFRRFAIDPRHVAVAGFSDGASYSLSLGLINGDVFREVVAFSPGYITEGERHGRPRFFISHGRDDGTLPFSHTKGDVVPSLRRAGYHLRFVAFDGRHEAPAPITRQAFRWFVRGR